MRKSDVERPRCGAAYKKIEVSSMKREARRLHARNLTQVLLMPGLTRLLFECGLDLISFDTRPGITGLV